MTGPGQRLRAALLLVAVLTVLIAAGSFLAIGLAEATRLGWWAVLLWAILVASGALAAEYLLIRMGFRRKR